MNSKSLIEVAEDTPAVFVVHGIGKQSLAETSAKLYARFDDTLDKILSDNIKSEEERRQKRNNWENEPLPFVHDGFWGDYDDVESFFGDHWSHLSKWEKSFLPELWKARVVSARTTYWWFIKQLFRLLNLKRNISIMRMHAWVSYPVYLLLAPAGFILLTLAYFRRNEILKDFLNDVRLYVDPKGRLEKKIRELIDDRVEDSFLRLIGLDREFRPLPSEKLIHVDGRPCRFQRVVWVAHSLGTVISYNVLDKLLSRAYELRNSEDAQVKTGVDILTNALVRFVTMGSPLDKVALLFGDKAVKRWDISWRKGFLDHGDEYERLWDKKKTKEWWVNFYHYFDPVSGSLGSEYLFKDDAPANFHSRSGWIPGLSHGAYWRDSRILRFIMSRAYGRAKLSDTALKHMPRPVRFALWVAGYAIWLLLLGLVIFATYVYGWPLLRELWKLIVEVLGGEVG